MIGVYAKCVCGFETTDKEEVAKFEVHEVSEEMHVAFCKSCAEALELNEGK